MKRKRYILQYVLDSSELGDESLPGQSVVELLGDSRIIIENHKRILQYDPLMISIRFSFGTLSIIGCNLQLRSMIGHKLLITGKIDRIELCRGLTNG